MSRAVAEWIGKTDDSKVPPHVRARIFKNRGGRCHLAGRVIRAGEPWDLDHIIALVNGGENRESNLAPALKDKHREKTAADVAEKAEVARKFAMWCTACGTVTRDGVCDCNRYGQDRKPSFVNYADQNHKDLLEECDRAEALEARALAAEARLAEAMKVIEPFVAQADCWPELPDNQALMTSDGEDLSSLDFNVSDLRAARAFTNAAKEKT